MNDLRKDSELVSEQDIRLRIRSLTDRIEIEENIKNPRDWFKYCEKLKKLNERRYALEYRLAYILKQQRSVGNAE